MKALNKLYIYPFSNIIFTGDVMKKGLYLILNQKHFIYIFFSLFFFVVIAVGYAAEKTVSASATAASNPIIVIDAGHGGEDGGTQSASGILEKDINLSISKKLNNILKDDGFNTVMIREDDRLIYDENLSTMRSKKSSDIHNRFSIMKKYPDCVFISIHQNYFTESKYSGAQVFYRPDHGESRSLAQNIQESIVNLIQKENTRQIKSCTSSVYLIYNAPVTAVMVECGFLSNAQEAERLSDENYQNDIALAISNGLKNYLQLRK